MGKGKEENGQGGGLLITPMRTRMRTCINNVGYFLILPVLLPAPRQRDGDGTDANKTDDLAFKDGEQYNAPAAWATITSALLQWGVSGDETWNHVDLIKAADSYTWTGTLNMTGITEARQFQLDINDVWLGQNEIAVNAPYGWITAGSSDGADITLNHDKTHFLTYTITATWTPSTDATAGWTVTIAGDTEAPKSTYTVNFVKGWADWSTVKVYAWNATEKLTDVWPGTVMIPTENTKYGFTIYTLSFEGYSAPTKVQFNDGTDYHKIEVDFTEGMTYDGFSLEEFTVGEKGWATAKTTNPVDFTYADKDLKAYIATRSGTTVTLTPATKVPAGTPLVLKGESAKVPVIASADPVENNALSWGVNYKVNETGYARCYGLAVIEGTARFAHIEDGTIIDNKAFIEIKNPTPVRELNVVFADEANSINAVMAEQSVEGIYNMNGQRVAAPAKGLYIVNGKKVIMK